MTTTSPRWLSGFGLAVRRAPRVPLVRALRAALREALRGVGLEVRRLAPPPPPPLYRRVAHAHYRGRRFLCFLDDYLGTSILEGRGWDNELSGVLDALSARTSSGDVLEVGANIGASLVPIAASHPGLTFHCVEPVPEFFELLQANAASFAEGGTRNVHLHNLALGAEEGQELELVVHVGTAGAVSGYDSHQPVQTVRLRTATIDGRFGHLDLRLLKLDVDGFEIDVLRGAQRTLARCRPACFLEFSTRIMRRRGVEPAAVTALLASHGYDHVSIFEAGRLIEQSGSLERLIAASDAADHYVDALIECRAAAPPLLPGPRG